MSSPDIEQTKRLARNAIVSMVGFTVLALAAATWAAGPGYAWIKALHVVAVISWMAGMLYLPRLFVYHAGVEPGSAQSETFKLMELRLLKVITSPAMLVAWMTGLWLAWQSVFYQAGWFHGKLLLVIALTGVHGYLSSAVKAFAADQNARQGRHWRLVNEIPTVLMLGIVVLVIVKPF